MVDKEESNIIKLATTSRLIPKEALKEITKKTGGYGFCQCSSVFVVEYTRMLECQKCGKTIDPFDFLWKVSQRESMKLWTNKVLTSQNKQLSENIDQLKKEERNIKARIRTAKKKINR